jgi:linoleate 8R-lipoxygenase / 9,12-octadecadienoate 8-hydroperoxide 8R-isomerase
MVGLPTRATLVQHHLADAPNTDLFDTDRKDSSISNTSSYLDLAPLYGNNKEEQAGVRTFVDGKLKPDAFSEKRILGFPPGVSALLVAFNRFHNYVVDNLAAINEGGRFSGRDRDNDLFQTGRLYVLGPIHPWLLRYADNFASITCGLYVNIILTDYLRAILNLGRSGSTWSLDPRINNNDVFDAQGTPKGIGNQVSVEFNLIYRWHSCISKRDEKWTEEFFKTSFPGIDPQKVSAQDLGKALSAWDATINEDPGKRVFGGLKRTGADGTGPFKDEELVKIIYEGIEDTAGT